MRAQAQNVRLRSVCVGGGGGGGWGRERAGVCPSRNNYKNAIFCLQLKPYFM